MRALILLMLISLIFLIGPYMLIKYWYRNVNFKVNDKIVWNGRAYQVTGISYEQGQTDYQITAMEGGTEIHVVDSRELDKSAIFKSQWDKIKESNK